MAVVMPTGGSGFLGIHVLQRLLQDGHQVRALVRSASKLHTNLALLGIDPDDRRIEVIPGDMTDHSSARAAARGCSLAIHASATYSYRRRDAQRMLRENVTLPHEMLRAVTGRKLPAVVVPLQAALPVLNLGYRTGWGFLPHTVEGARVVAQDTRVDHSATSEDLGVVGLPLEESAHDTVRWLVAAGHGGRGIGRRDELGWRMPLGADPHVRQGCGPARSPHRTRGRAHDVRPRRLQRGLVRRRRGTDRARGGRVDRGILADRRHRLTRPRD